jgi:glycosyltransferase involved in cell wall biosynthesis
MNNLLIIAFHYPPQSGSSGVLRTLKFSRYLPESGWLPTVLTAHPRAYEKTDFRQLQEIPPEVAVLRAFALDTKRHLACRGRYLSLMALPDRWISWALAAVPLALRQIRRKQIDVLYTTYPIATAVLIGLILHRITSLPWVIDFRDSMTENDYPRDPAVRRTYEWIERRSVRHASALVFTAESTRSMYLARYPSLDPSTCLVIPNGYDESDFAGIQGKLSPELNPHRPVRLLHSGLIYPEERDPRPFFRAVSRLKKNSRLQASQVRIDLRAAGFEDEYCVLLHDLDIEDIVSFLPPLPYRDALEDAAEADAFLLFQAANCNHQIPAKIYEYLYLRKPILALTSDDGDTANLLRGTDAASIVDLADDQAISDILPGFIESVRAGRHSLPDPLKVEKFSRRGQARLLADSLNKLLRPVLRDGK